MIKIITIISALGAGIAYYLGGHAPENIGDIRGLLSPLVESAGSLFEFIKNSEHPFVLLGIILGGTILVYRVVRTILIVGAVAAVVFVLVTSLQIV